MIVTPRRRCGMEEDNLLIAEDGDVDVEAGTVFVSRNMVSFLNRQS